MSLPLAEILAVEANTEASIIALLDSCLPAPTTGAKLIYPKRSARTADTVLLVDIRELGTIDSFDDGDNLDFSVLSWFLFIQINPDAWPVNL
jgi:hypothetical protein